MICKSIASLLISHLLMVQPVDEALVTKLWQSSAGGNVLPHNSVWGSTCSSSTTICWQSISGTSCSFSYYYKLDFTENYTRVYPKVSGLATWSKNCKW